MKRAMARAYLEEAETCLNDADYYLEELGLGNQGLLEMAREVETIRFVLKDELGGKNISQE